MMRLQPHKWHKTSTQAIPVRFVGIINYSTSTYCVYIPGQHQVINTRNVIFDTRSASRPPVDISTPLVYAPLLDDEEHVLLTSLADEPEPQDEAASDSAPIVDP